jgi:sugar/nucleoside kinase (ribokinase family)
MSPMDAMRFATCVATLSVTKEGAASSMPTRAEVLELFKKTFG